MMQELLIAFCLMLVIEGILPFLAPDRWRRMLEAVSEVDDRARFIVAYEYYQAAGNSMKMNQAAQQFPTMSTIFTANKEVGEKVSVGCWIQKTVGLKKRVE